MATDLLIGQQLGQYEIKTLLGRGGMATVYIATQHSMDREVAIKVMSKELSHDPEFISRFEREAKIFAILQHPHILPVIDFGNADGFIYIVMRLVTGGSLDSYLGNTPLPLATTAQIINQLGSALDFAHSKGIIHRDLKPNNVLLDEDQNAYLTDFGIAKMLSGNARLTATNTVLGTPAYMAPEQWRGDMVDARADIYSLGVMLYEMVTGRLPFEAETSFSLMYKHMNEVPPAPSEYMAGLPLEIENVIMQALAKDPAGRYGSAAAMSKAFSAAVSNVDSEKIIAVKEASNRPTKSNAPNLTSATLAGDSAIAEDKTFVMSGSEVQKMPERTGTSRPALPMIGLAALVVVGLIAAGIAALMSSGEEADDPVANNSINLADIPHRIAYNRSTTESQDIYYMKADGSEVRFVGTGGKPSWSANGQLIAFDSAFTGNPEIFAIGLDGSNMKNLTNNPAQEYFAAFSPDGESIAFHTDRDSNFEIYVMKPDGSGQFRLTNNPASDQWPDWSPDGSKIAFASQRDGNLEIYVMDANGGNLRRLTEDAAADLWATWSPDGSKIAFQSNRDGNFEIYVMNADGSQQTRLTYTAGDEQWPDWSPSEYITFSSNEDGNQEIYIIRPDGKNLTRVTNSATDERFPVWSQ